MPDKLTDEHWNKDVWKNLKKAQIICADEKNRRELPDAAYMEMKHMQYQELSKNNLDPNNPVIMEQLNWLDMTVIPQTSETVKNEIEIVEKSMEKNGSPNEFSKSDIEKLLQQHTVEFKEATDIVDGKKEPPNGKKKNDWIRENGYLLKKLESLIKQDADAKSTYDYGENDGKISGSDMIKLFQFFSKFFPKASTDTFNKLQNRLNEETYTFYIADNQYRFRIVSAKPSNQTTYLFCREPFDEKK